MLMWWVAESIGCQAFLRISTVIMVLLLPIITYYYLCYYHIIIHYLNSTSKARLCQNSE